MSKIPSEEFMIGETTIVVHSHLVTMTAEERKLWFKTELEKGNKILLEIVEAANACFVEATLQ
ncbi:hypothetical protein [Sutcliffiella horikoshii]|uniref:hypothetical protein n=1 Tax=Sutcliffiella horikoshii TaxID=79883 RepID=UPI00384A5526